MIADPLVKDEKMVVWLNRRLDRLFSDFKKIFSDIDGASAMIGSIQANTNNFVAREIYLDYSEITEYLNMCNTTQVINLLFDVEEQVENVLQMKPGSASSNKDAAVDMLDGPSGRAIKEAAAWAGLKVLYGEATESYGSAAKRRLSLSRSAERKRRMQTNALKSSLQFQSPSAHQSLLSRPSSSSKGIFYDNDNSSDLTLIEHSPKAMLPLAHQVATPRI